MLPRALDYLWLCYLVLLGQWTPMLAAPPTSAEIAARVDRHVTYALETEKVRPAALVDDAGFARRVYLDLVGRIPTLAEVRAFLDDTSPKKRERLVARLLESGAYPRHAATVWRRELVPQTDTPQFAALATELDRWLANQLRDDKPFDRIARDLLTATRGPSPRSTPTTFLAASEFKPENLAANATRAFLGINLDCAQCHDHPFARWSRNQFWETAAFFTAPPSGRAGTVGLELTIPNTARKVRPRVLTGNLPTWPEILNADTGRLLFAEWVTAKDNPYFARNVVNRLWANLFGTGLVEPLDDLSEDNPASHPQLLQELSRDLIESSFDLKRLTTGIILSRTYQRSSIKPDESIPDPRLFARAAVRGLTGEQLLASLRVAAGLTADEEDQEQTPAGRERKRFIDRFRLERSIRAERSILQALSLMNSKFTADLTNPAGSPALRAVADAPFLDARGKIESLFLATLSRKPTRDELTPLVQYLETGGADCNANKALADMFWALLNSSEFNTNH